MISKLKVSIHTDSKIHNLLRIRAQQKERLEVILPVLFLHIMINISMSLSLYLAHA
jgi:hypothetical protein